MFVNLVACVTGGISVECCIVLAAEPREDWVFAKIPRGFLASRGGSAAKKYPWQKDPASYCT